MSLASVMLKIGDLPGAAALKMEIIAGRQHFSINGQTISVDAGASDEEAAAAIRAKLTAQGVTEMPLNAPTPGRNDTASLLPQVGLQQETKPMSNPGSFSARLKAMLDTAKSGLQQAQAQGEARVQEAVNKLNDAATKTVNVSESTAKSIEDAASNALADLGQISNEI